MIKKIIFVFLLIQLMFFSSKRVLGQENIADSSILMPAIKLGYSAGFPQLDLKERMGFTSIINSRFEIKFRSQWIVGAHYNFMFGRSIKDSGMIKELLTSSGGIINSNGEFGTYEMLQRGHHAGVYIGRLFPYFSPNLNSGIVATIGAGIFTHKINFNNISGDLVQLNGEYKKGYDRYTAGFSLTEFIGYQYLSNNRLLNFYGGIELTQAFTKIRRGYQVDYSLDDPRFGERKDFLISIQIGWILPLYRRPPKEFYY